MLAVLEAIARRGARGTQLALLERSALEPPAANLQPMGGAGGVDQESASSKPDQAGGAYVHIHANHTGIYYDTYIHFIYTWHGVAAVQSSDGT